VELEVEEVSVTVGGVSVEDSSYQSGDTLWVKLPEVVRRDSVAVRFTTKVFEEATLFEGMVLHSGKPGVWQGIESADGEALKVYVPSVGEEEALIRNVRLTPPVISPNGDGVNEALEVAFDLAKVRVEPEVRAYSLAGVLVRTLTRGEGQSYVYLWDGRDSSGELVSPGMYVLQIRVETDIGTEVTSKTVGVVY